MPPPLVALRAAAVRIGERRLFEQVDVGIGRGDRVCLVGRNGSGKSTLLRALANQIEIDAGERFVQPRTTIAYLLQEPNIDPDRTVLDAVLDGLDGHDDRDTAGHRGEAMLADLGLDPVRMTNGLSGGEIRRIAIARALIGMPEILLLDEPTNHLDLPAIAWLEDRLAAFAGGLVIISHDRALLRRIGRSCWWLDRGRLHQLDRGFDHFEAWSDELLGAEATEARQLERRIAIETDWSHHGITARRKRNQGRLRRLAEMRRTRAARIRPTGAVKLDTEAGPKSGRMVIEAKSIAKAYDGNCLFNDFSTRIMRGDRIGIIGPNGSGKTTLLDVLTGTTTADSGSVELGTNLAIARFEQDRRSLDPDATPWRHLCPDGGDQVQVRGHWMHVVGYLRDFLFREDQARTPIRALSGGERNRLVLATILARPANLLVLDEPTNDLDMETLDLLQETLADYAGTVLLTSHDRDFLDRLVTSVIAFEGNGQVQEYAGGYSDYLVQRAPRPTSITKAPKVKTKPAARPMRRSVGLDRRLQRELDRLPDKIEDHETMITDVEAALSDVDLYRRDPAAYSARSEQLESLRHDLETLEERWLELEDLRQAAASKELRETRIE